MGTGTRSRSFVSILMLTHNAPEYVRTSIHSLRERTRGVDYELVVLDNASDPRTVALLEEERAAGRIDKLILSGENTLFARGNNLAAAAASERATHFLLLNSDIEVRDPDWLANLMGRHGSPGMTSYGMVTDAPVRIDGYCLLCDADLYRALGGLDEHFAWWWAVTRLQAQAMHGGAAVRGYSRHEKWLHHFGGKSGHDFQGACGMGTSRAEVMSWFDGRKPKNLSPAGYLDGSVLLRSGRKVARRMRLAATAATTMGLKPGSVGGR